MHRRILMVHPDSKSKLRPVGNSPVPDFGRIVILLFIIFLYEKEVFIF